MIFFDDYSNTLVVGNTARSLTDHLKISREKLAYIVDSTAAPVACIALITTWIGYQIGLIEQSLRTIEELDGVQAYTVFIQSIPYSFYPILAIVFVLIVAATGRDFGPMYTAELRARKGDVKPVSAEELPALEGDDLVPKENIPLRAFNAFIPIIVLIIGLGVSLVMLGEGETLTEILESTEPYKAMMYSSFVGVLVAACLSIGQRILSVHETIDAWYGGLRATMFGMIILVLAWSLSDVTAVSEHGVVPCDPAGRRTPGRFDSGGGVRSRCDYGIHDGDELGNDGDPDAAGPAAGLGRDDRFRYCGSERHAHTVFIRCLRTGGRRLGGSLFADFGYDGAVIDRQRLQPHRTCSYPVTLRADSWRRGTCHRYDSGRFRIVALDIDPRRYDSVVCHDEILRKTR